MSTEGFLFSPVRSLTNVSTPNTVDNTDLLLLSDPNLPNDIALVSYAFTSKPKSEPILMSGSPPPRPSLTLAIPDHLSNQYKAISPFPTPAEPADVISLSFFGGLTGYNSFQILKSSPVTVKSPGLIVILF